MKTRYRRRFAITTFAIWLIITLTGCANTNEMVSENLGLIAILAAVAAGAALLIIAILFQKMCQYKNICVQKEQEIAEIKRANAREMQEKQKNYEQRIEYEHKLKDDAVRRTQEEYCKQLRNQDFEIQDLQFDLDEQTRKVRKLEKSLSDLRAKLEIIKRLHPDIEKEIEEQS